jgi:anti-sigma regulatory factor (Ser/Thr protein kinase)
MHPTDAPAIFKAKYPATHDGLAQLLAEFDQLTPSSRWGDRLAFACRLTLEELVINVVNHSGQTTADRWFAVSIIESAELLAVVVEDPGRPFDPTQRSSPDLDASLDDREPGGLGVMLIKNLVDELHYRRKDGVNQTTAVLERRMTNG